MMAPCIVNLCLFVCLITVRIIKADDHDKYVFGKKNEHILSNPDKYHLVRPYRSTPDGDFLTHDLSTEFEDDQFDFHQLRRRAERRRRRRSAVGENSLELEGALNQKVFHFSMEAFGKQFTLNVTRDKELVAPGFEVHHWQPNGTIKIEKPQVNCFYRGNVIGSDRSSTVALSNCHGMSGMIKIFDEEYFIEPLEMDGKHSETYNFTENGSIHVMYRSRDALPNNTDALVPGAMDFNGDIMHTSAQVRRNIMTNRTLTRSRSKREPTIITDQHYVETMLTLDYSVLSFHGTDNITTYILTIMNIVNAIYSHPSLQAKIEFVITRVNILNEESSNQWVVLGNSSQSLLNTCRFARDQRMVVRDDGSPGYFDHSIFITRISLGEPVLGKAYLSTMCSLGKSCSVSLDMGIWSASIIAHEVGHTLGLVHNGHDNCVGDADSEAIMASCTTFGDVSKSLRGYYWSECSRNHLHENFPGLTCLLDKPSGGARAVGFDLNSLGMNFTIDQQCRFQFGDTFRAVRGRFEESCRELLCEVDGNAMYYTKGPALERSTCGIHMECINERCVKTADHPTPPPPVDGGWGQWESWEPCSYSCGLGVQARRRKCDNPVPDRGADCSGNSTEKRLCNLQDCPDGPTDKRQDQCRDYGEKLDLPLLPYQNPYPRMSCQLSCVAEETGEIFVSSNFVRDGTPVSYTSPEIICIDGQPKNIGCDVIMGSKKLWDNCGVCGGSNGTCIYDKTDLIDESPKSNKYQKLFQITPGMRNIKISKTAESFHFLALKIKENGKYILNRGKQQTPPHAFSKFGMSFVYTWRRGKEVLLIKGPIPTVINLMVYARDMRPVSYRIEMYKDYGDEVPDVIAGQTELDEIQGGEEAVGEALPSIPEKTDYFWKQIGHAECSKSCGGGSSEYQFQCTRFKGNLWINFKACGKRNYKRNPVILPCNEDPCPIEPTMPTDVVTFQWQASAWSECSATCGGSAYQTRNVQCLKIINGDPTLDTDDACKAPIRPHVRQQCGLQPCRGRWVKHPWSECSVSCGKGVMRRTVRCQVPMWGYEDDYVCSGKKPPSEKRCKLPKCRRRW